MIGGINWPPVDAAASMPPASSREKPSRFIIGMVSAPVVTVLAMADPDTEPSAAEASTAAFAGPPRDRPAAANANWMKNRPPPVVSRRAPKSTKTKTVLLATPIGSPKRPAPVNTSNRMIRSSSKPRWARNPGSEAPKAL